MEVQRWAQKSWKVTAGVQVLELGGFSFLFLLPSFEEAQRVLKGKWNFRGKKRRLDLEWWSPVGCCVKPGDASSEVWIKILGLHLHLWDFEVFREIGDHCGGFLYVDEDTRQQAHLRWARIAVWAPPENIPATVKIAMGSWLFEVTLWVEKGPEVLFQPSLGVCKERQGVVAGSSVGGFFGGGKRRRVEVMRMVQVGLRLEGGTDLVGIQILNHVRVGGLGFGLGLGDSALVLRERVDEVGCEGRVSELWCGGESVALGGSFGRRRFSMEMGEGLGLGRAFRGCVAEADEGEPGEEWNEEDKLVSGIVTRRSLKMGFEEDYWLQ
ncbi:hypothetical protein RHGRI_016810 [Rhododendron griersonianum]|uniref:DUF4283 domain-containing protein n=1 Tax=Rhododendron griersonianum TaxID=479676 RepID=A0AAV6JVH8_9ERIC|nr:hypothetical protein RHGRI_016810 [Rhododendron griersonianum]